MKQKSRKNENINKEQAHESNTFFFKGSKNQSSK